MGRETNLEAVAEQPWVDESSSSTQSNVLELVDVRVRFDEHLAVAGINITVARGESVGIIGESGCGKSVTWLAALGLLPRKAHVSGRVRLDGEDILHAPLRALETVRGRRVAMIFQDPASSLNPTHRVGAQIMEVLRLHRGMEGGTVRAEAKRLFEQVGIPDAARRLDAYPHELSGGQNQRVMIAMALAGQPDILIADEPTTALDVTIQAQILKLLRDIQKDTGMAVVLISHDLGVIAEVCSRAYVMYAGRIVEEGEVSTLFAVPSHPYTRGLLHALPSLTEPRRRLASIPGGVPLPGEVRGGCAFAPRCAEKADICRASEPGLRHLRSPQLREHRVACLKTDVVASVEDAA